MKESKKIPAKIYSFVEAIKPGISKNTSYDEAWDIIADYGGLDGEIRSTHQTKQTKFILMRGEKEICDFDWDNKDVFKESEGDWDWANLGSLIEEKTMVGIDTVFAIVRIKLYLVMNGLVKTIFYLSQLKK